MSNPGLMNDYQQSPRASYLDSLTILIGMGIALALVIYMFSQL